jgi:sulfur-carrier protein adenylyltransferase/sulfurtransferase
MAGHILTAPPGGNYDGRYLFKGGRFLRRMSEWPDDGVKALPACGGSYIPGGPVALARIAGQTVQHALDQLVNSLNNPEWHVLIGNVKTIKDYGGKYKGPDLPENVGSSELNYTWPSPESLV